MFFGHFGKGPCRPLPGNQEIFRHRSLSPFEDVSQSFFVEMLGLLKTSDGVVVQVKVELEINKKIYPVEKAKGNAKKYTEI